MATTIIRGHPQNGRRNAGLLPKTKARIPPRKQGAYCSRDSRANVLCCRGAHRTDSTDSPTGTHHLGTALISRNMAVSPMYVGTSYGSPQLGPLIEVLNVRSRASKRFRVK